MMHYRLLFAVPHVAFWVIVFFSRDEFEAATIRKLMLAWVIGLLVSAFVPGLRILFSTAIAIVDIVLLALAFGWDARKI